MAVTELRSDIDAAIRRLDTGERAFNVKWNDGHEAYFTTCGCASTAPARLAGTWIRVSAPL